MMVTLFNQEEAWDMRWRSEEKEVAIKTTIEDEKSYKLILYTILELMNSILYKSFFHHRKYGV